ncbi:Hypothetical protein NTJ_12466 [Nesidiocoris tenuis]|uniref:Uncharacterized protein n=1 Tax=Nesidiocoris tenuis TaxID=355587 RepID=A0ABN7B720_9HEMI|nr:Hypothetical protein NTJ_12466 [Nesidiocoris tenuis]
MSRMEGSAETEPMFLRVPVNLTEVGRKGLQSGELVALRKGKGDARLAVTYRCQSPRVRASRTIIIQDQGSPGVSDRRAAVDIMLPLH